MISSIGFYNLKKTTLERALLQLLKKILQMNERVVIMTGSKERVDFLDQLLWTSDANSWIPHGTSCDEEIDCQPIYLTDEDENPNNATILLLIDGAVSCKLMDFSRCLILFDGKDENVLQMQRIFWKKWKNPGVNFIYYQQNDHGAWQEKIL
ncbi:MAG: DNA polymerase III subunit chi [Rhodospirillaceae bacterium]|jgi:DNA polymerase-3 subunit chi|nr:DNA polymerase III subunit chi [Rhodospirillaceae bacterium]